MPENKAKLGSIGSDKAVDREGNVTEDDNEALKRDDEGAIEQQEAAVEAAAILEAEDEIAREAGVEPSSEPFSPFELGVPVVENDGRGSIRIVSKRDADLTKGGKPSVAQDAALNDKDLWLEGKGFDRGEVSLDVIGPQGSRVRFAAWVDDPDEGRFLMQLTAINAPGDWEIVAYHNVTTVGEGRDDHRRVIQECDRKSVTIRG